MRTFLALAVVVTAGLVALSAVIAEPGRSTPLRPAIDDDEVVDYLRMEADNDPKFPGPRPVHVLGQDTAVVFARTRGIERLEIVVQLSSTETFGVFSGTPDRNGLVSIEVKVPDGGSRHDFRMPGPEGKREPGQIRPGNVFMLAPHGYVANGIHLSGGAVWVRLEE